jgi:hypothetical protein
MPATFDAVDAISTGVSGVQSQAMGIIGVVAPAALIILGAVIAIRKGMSLFRGLIGR